MKKKIKCHKCTKDAVIIDNKIYYCGPCYILIKQIKKKNI
jgi:hypothetical protein